MVSEANLGGIVPLSNETAALQHNYVGSNQCKRRSCMGVMPTLSAGNCPASDIKSGYFASSPTTCGWAYKMVQNISL